MPSFRANEISNCHGHESLITLGADGFFIFYDMHSSNAPETLEYKGEFDTLSCQATLQVLNSM